LRDHSAQLKIEPSGEFSYKVDASGFRPEELSVEVHGKEVVIKGEHIEKTERILLKLILQIMVQFRRVCAPPVCSSRLHS
jgi:HSP20 family molecular chaperone IbpA